jgi:hypothetical protein
LIQELTLQANVETPKRSNIMPPKQQQQRQASSATPDSLPSTSDLLPDELRREDVTGPTAIAPDSLPIPEDEVEGPTSQHVLLPDGGAPDHPIHDDDPTQDFLPRDYEEQIEEVEEARNDARKRADVNER